MEVSGSDDTTGLPALGVLAFMIDGSQSAKLGRITRIAWRRAGMSGHQELEIIAQFSAKVVSVSVCVPGDLADRMRLAS